MKKVLLTGCGGQIGSELTLELRNRLGGANVVASDIRDLSDCALSETGQYGQAVCLGDG